MLWAGLGGQHSPRLPEEMTWWQYSPSASTSGDRLGLSTRQVLSMGFDRWSDYVLRVERKRGREPFSIAFSSDGTKQVFGACLFERNEGLLSKRSSQIRDRIRRLRPQLYQFGMACIGLEDVLAGGGTYVAHSPSSCFVDVEATIYDLLSGQQMSGPSLAKIRGRLAAYRDRREPFRHRVTEGWAPAATVRAWTARADRHMGNVVSESSGFPRAGQNRLRRFLWTWADYLAVRGTG